MFLFLQNLFHICCRFSAVHIKVKPIMRLCTAHSCHIWPMRNPIFSGWPIRSKEEGAGWWVHDRTHIIAIIVTASPGHSHSIHARCHTANIVHSEILNLKMPGQWAHNWPSDGQNMALWQMGTREIWPMVITCQMASDWPGLSLSRALIGSWFGITPLSKSGFESFVCFVMLQAPRLRANNKCYDLTSNMLHLISGDVVRWGRGLWEALFWI